MNKFTQIFQSEQDKTYVVTVETLLGEAKVQGSFQVVDKTLSLAKDKVKAMLVEKRDNWVVTSITEKEAAA